MSIYEKQEHIYIETELTYNEKIKKIDIEIEHFWQFNLWKCDYKNIYNEKISNIIKSVQTHSDPITRDKIDINYIKSYSYCIPEYHILIINLKNKYCL
jgi:hypothetical protein